MICNERECRNKAVTETDGIHRCESCVRAMFALTEDEISRLKLDYRIFCCCMTTGWVWSDRRRERHGDYVRLGYMSYERLVLELEKDCPKDLAMMILEDAARLQERRGERYRIAGNMTVTLGGAA